MKINDVQSRVDAIELIASAVRVYQDAGIKTPAPVLQCLAELANPMNDWEGSLYQMSESLMEEDLPRPFLVNGDVVISRSPYDAYVEVAEEYETHDREPYVEGDAVGVLTEEYYRNDGERVT